MQITAGLLALKTWPALTTLSYNPFGAACALSGAQKTILDRNQPPKTNQPTNQPKLMTTKKPLTLAEFASLGGKASSSRLTKEQRIARATKASHAARAAGKQLGRPRKVQP